MTNLHTTAAVDGSLLPCHCLLECSCYGRQQQIYTFDTPFSNFACDCHHPQELLYAAITSKFLSWGWGEVFSHLICDIAFFDLSFFFFVGIYVFCSSIGLQAIGPGPHHAVATINCRAPDAAAVGIYCILTIHYRPSFVSHIHHLFPVVQQRVAPLAALSCDQVTLLHGLVLRSQALSTTSESMLSPLAAFTLSKRRTVKFCYACCTPVNNKLPVKHLEVESM